MIGSQKSIQAYNYLGVCGKLYSRLLKPIRASHFSKWGKDTLQLHLFTFLEVRIFLDLATPSHACTHPGSRSFCPVPEVKGKRSPQRRPESLSEPMPDLCHVYSSRSAVSCSEGASCMPLSVSFQSQVLLFERKLGWKATQCKKIWQCQWAAGFT